MPVSPDPNNPNYWKRAGTIPLHYVAGSVNRTGGFDYWRRAGSIPFRTATVFWYPAGEHSLIVKQAVNRASTY